MPVGHGISPQETLQRLVAAFPSPHRPRPAGGAVPCLIVEVGLASGGKRAPRRARSARYCQLRAPATGKNIGLRPQATPPTPPKPSTWCQRYERSHVQHDGQPPQHPASCFAATAGAAVTDVEFWPCRLVPSPSSDPAGRGGGPHRRGSLFGNGIQWVRTHQLVQPGLQQRTIELCHGDDLICNPPIPRTGGTTGRPPGNRPAGHHAGMVNPGDFVAGRI